MIVEVTRDRIMHPWPPRPDPALRLVGERWLTDAEIALLARWTAAGCPDGDVAELPPPVRFAEGWSLGRPDLVVRMPEAFTVPADGPDVFRNFVVPLDIPTDQVVAAIEFRPGDHRVVHHAVLFLDESGTARRLDAADPRPGYEGFGGPGFLPSGALGGWSVGNTPRRLPGGRGRYLRRGSDLVVQVHYHPDGVERTDQSEIGIFFVDEAVFDNSAGNPSNPSSPPRRVTWGDGTLDEMRFCFFLVSADTTEDLVHVVLDNLGHDLRQPRGRP